MLKEEAVEEVADIFAVSRTYYTYHLPEAETPHPSCRCKHSVRRVMFLAAVGRPRWDTKRNW